jgi:hypothetical protein
MTKLIVVFRNFSRYSGAVINKMNLVCQAMQLVSSNFPIVQGICLLKMYQQRVLQLGGAPSSVSHMPVISSVLEHSLITVQGCPVIVTENTALSFCTGKCQELRMYSSKHLLKIVLVARRSDSMLIEIIHVVGFGSQ